MGRLTLLEAGGMDVFKGAAFKPPPRRSEEEGSFFFFAFLPYPNSKKKPSTA